MAAGIDLLMFAVVCVCLLAGFPVAFTLAGVALWFALMGVAFGFFDFSFVGALPQRIFGTMTNTTLIAVPLFVFMGVMLERSKVAEELLTAMGRLFGTLRGGLGISVTIVGALLAASTGIVGATVVTMGLLSLPTMLRRGYDPALAAGTVSAAGTLGQIIPPSIVLVLLGDVIANSYQTAQLATGVFAPKTVSVGDLFAGALLPGLMLVALYILYQVVTAILYPDKSPAIPADEAAGRQKDLFKSIFTALIPPLTLIVAVLGSILGGVATPTEAAAIGAIGAILLAGYRTGKQIDPEPNGHRRSLLYQTLRVFDFPGSLPIVAAALALGFMVILTATFDLRIARNTISVTEQSAIYVAYGLSLLLAWGTLVSLKRVLATGVLKEVMTSTTQISSMVFAILIGAALFSLVFRGLGGDETIRGILMDMPGGATGAMLVVMLVMFFLGFFLDFIEIIFVVVPIVGPILLMMGIDPVWLGVMMAINLQTSFLTPPFGFALFYLRGVAPSEIKTSHIYKGAIPFVLIQIFALAILTLFPQIATWLPSVIY
ncbi:MAG: TRAP transporter large permease subunit [Alphaproteobacteria bacterium]|nr:MAG: TRAP transporter large permease subunit [Alphaproteobacteria bacterium]